MIYRLLYLPLALSLLYTTTLLGQHAHRQFADKRMIGFQLGCFVGEIREGFELESHNSLRLGVSINDRWYTGGRTQVILARNFETPLQVFYSSGVWVRYYESKNSIRVRPWSLNVFCESGLMVSNFAFEYRSLTTYYLPKNGTFYLPFSFGLNLWLTNNISLEAGLQFYYNIGKPWSSHGYGHPSLGVNWFLFD